MGLSRADFTKQNFIKQYGVNDNVTFLIDTCIKNTSFIASCPSTIKLEQVSEKFFININGAHSITLPKYSKLGKLFKRIWAWFSLRTFGNSKLTAAAEKVQELANPFFQDQNTLPKATGCTNHLATDWEVIPASNGIDAKSRIKEVFALIEKESGMELANIMDIMLQKEHEKTGQDPISDYTFVNGILQITLRKQIRMWVESKDEDGTLAPPGGVIFIVGNSDKILQVKLAPSKAEILNATITTYNKPPSSFAFFSEFIEPTVLSMQYENGYIVTKGRYLAFKAEKGLPYKSQLDIWQAGEILVSETLCKKNLQNKIKQKLQSPSS